MRTAGSGSTSRRRAGGLLVLGALLQATLAAQDPGEDGAPVALQVAGDAFLELEAAWDRCRESKYGLFEKHATLRSPAPAEARRRHPAAHFAPFLPPGPVTLGAVWEVDREAVLVFLRQLHPGARTELHHGFGSAPGTYACLRAVSPRHVEILLRTHAEFELEGGIFYTPAQFEGRLVLDRRTGVPIFFRLSLPNRNTNVDVNVPIEVSQADGGPPLGTMSADIGWVPRMELTGGEACAEGWERSISDEEARARLARAFYAFAAIAWLPFEQAVTRSRHLSKPLHVVVLFGALDDESC